MSTKARLQSILTNTGAPAGMFLTREEERKFIFDLLFETLIPDGIASTGIQFDINIFYPGYFDDEDRPSHIFSDKVLDYLKDFKSKVQDNFDSTHAALVAETKKMSLASGLLNAALSAKEKNARKIEDAETAYNAAVEQREASMQTFLQARRAEEYLRMALTAYESQSIDDALWGVLMCLRTDNYSLLSDDEKSKRRERVSKLASRF